MSITPSSPPNSSPTREGFFPFTFSLAVLICVVLAFKDCTLDANNIPSGSMIPTLKIGDYLFVNKMRYSIRLPFIGREIWRHDNPKRGDIITFQSPNPSEQQHYVKRVMAIAGDRIRLREIRACDLMQLSEPPLRVLLKRICLKKLLLKRQKKGFFPVVQVKEAFRNRFSAC